MKRKVFSLFLFLIAAGLAYYLISAISKEVKSDKYIKVTEKKIKDKLEFIRDIELLYKSRYGKYTDNWDSLRHFVRNENIYITQRKEESYGSFDSVRVKVDTLSVIPVRDSLKNSPDYKKYNLDSIEYVPETGEKFKLYAGTIKKEKAIIPVFEVKNPKPVNPERTKPNTLQDTLKVGDKYSPETKGNWK